MSAEAAENAIRAFAHGHKVVRLQDEVALVEAIVLSVRYDYCHYLDSIYLIHSRNIDAVLVTYDSRLRDVAGMEGIMTSSPDNFSSCK